MSINIKKLRVMWKEKIELNHGENIDFLCSFDDGKKWISFNEMLSNIRTPFIGSKKIPLSSYEMINDEYSNIDFTIPLTFDAIPGISDQNCSITPYEENSNLGLPAGNYFIRVAGITSDFVGMNLSNTKISTVSSLSAAKSFNIIERGDINLGLQFSNSIRGFAVYMGKKTTLNFETNITENTTSTVIFSNYKCTNYSGEDIPIEKGFIYGGSFINNVNNSSAIITNSNNSTNITNTDINNIEITNNNKLILNLNNIVLHTNDKIKLVLDVVHYRLVFISNLTTKLIKSIESNSSDPIYIENRYPLPFSGRIRINSEYIKYENQTFDTNSEHPLGFYKLSGITRESITSRHEIGSSVFVSLLDGGFFGELPKKSIAIYENTENLKQYFHFDASAYSDIVIDMAGNNNAKIIGTVDFTTTESFLKSAANFNKAGILVSEYDFKPNGTIHFYFKIEELPNTDMVIFGNNTGLKLTLSKDNLRLSLEYNNNIIIRNDNPKLSKIKIGEWTEIGICWQHSSAFSSNKVYLYKDGILEIDENMSISLGNQYFGIGGLLTSSIVNNNYSNVTYSNMFKGKIDDWRIYDTCLNLDQLLALDTALKKLGFEYCGIINIDKRFVKREVNNTPDKLLDYYLFDSNILKYEPYVPTYFSVLETDEAKLNLLNTYSETCDLWPLPAIENGNLFNTDNLLEQESDPENLYNKVYKKANGTVIPKINYPGNIETIKYSFSLTGKSDGINSPIIKDFATIISNSTIDF